MIRGLLFVAACIVLPAHAQDQERAPFITTPDDVVVEMLRFAGTGPKDLVVDLGSGDGRIVITAAKTFGARGLGIELEGPLVRKSRENAANAGVADRTTFVEGDVLTADLSKANVVTVYLLPFLINKLQPRLLDELEPGTRVVSHAFQMAGWRPDRSQVVRVASSHPGQGGESTLFLWVVPAKVRGEWRGDGLHLRISQNFQELEVEGSNSGAPLAGVRATLTGREIALETAAFRFRGNVEGDRIVGRLLAGDQSRPIVLSRTR